MIQITDMLTLNIDYLSTKSLKQALHMEKKFVLIQISSIKDFIDIHDNMLLNYCRENVQWDIHIKNDIFETFVEKDLAILFGLFCDSRSVEKFTYILTSSNLKNIINFKHWLKIGWERCYNKEKCIVLANDYLKLIEDDRVIKNCIDNNYKLFIESDLLS